MALPTSGGTPPSVALRGWASLAEMELKALFDCRDFVGFSGFGAVEGISG
jgi:hypothetical protein